MASTILATFNGECQIHTSKTTTFHVLPSSDMDSFQPVSDKILCTVIDEESKPQTLQNGHGCHDGNSDFRSDMTTPKKDESGLENVASCQSCLSVGIAEKRVRRHHVEEKFVYVISVATLSLITHSMISAQYLIPYYYAISTPFLLLIRTIIYFLCDWRYFLLDFCYYGNIMCYVFLWAIPKQPEYFCVLFGLANGPMLWALVLFRNSLVFHSFDKTVSVFLHLMPSIVTFVIRWYPVESSRLWYTDFMPVFSDWSLTWLIGVPLACYVLHSVLLMLLMKYILKPPEDCQTIYRLLTYKQGFMYRSFNILGPRFRPWIYNMYYFGFCLLSLIFTLLWYNFFLAHCAAIIAVAVVATYNGACYYMEVFRGRLKKGNSESDEQLIEDEDVIT